MITAITPHTRIDNSVILNMAEIGVYGFAVYCAIKMHLNQATGACFPSYATIARLTGINRSTVIEYVKRLRARNLVDPRHRFKEDGSFTSNQYNFQGAGSSAPAQKIDPSTKNHGAGRAAPATGASPGAPPVGSGPEPPGVVAEDNPPGRPEPPEQSEANKKQRTMTEVDLMPSEKQQTCPHPSELIVLLPDHITICNHCYGLLDANFQLLTKQCPAADTERMHAGESPPARVAA